MLMYGANYIVFILLLDILLFAVSHEQGISKLKYVHIISRHGDRTPYSDRFPLDNFSKEGIAKEQLTPLGYKQHYDIGIGFRKEYIEEIFFLNRSLVHQEVICRSTDLERTLASASAQLMGLYPAGTGPLINSTEYSIPGGIQPPICRTEPTDLDYYLYQDSICEKFLDRWVSVCHSKEIREKEEAEAQFFQYIRNVSGLQEVNFCNIEDIYDQVYYICNHNVQYPGINSTVLDHIVMLRDFQLALVFPNDPKVGKFSCSMFLQTLCEKLQLASTTGVTSKFELNLAHDYTLLSIMGALGISDLKSPPISSVLVFELYENNSIPEANSSSFFVVIKYNGVELYLPGMEGSRASISEFQSAIRLVTGDVADNLISPFDLSYCKASSNPDGFKLDFSVILGVVVSMGCISALLFLLALITWSVFIKWRLSKMNSSKPKADSERDGEGERLLNNL